MVMLSDALRLFRQRYKSFEMQQRTLGRNGLTVPAIGFGCASLSSAYGPSDDEESVTAIQHAISAGVNLLDTSDAYGNGHNETLVGRAIKGHRDEVILCSKFGNKRGADGARLGANGRPEHVIASCEASLKRLGVETIDLYYQHRVDPRVPIEETFGAVKQLIEQGKVRFAGMCEAGADTIRRAHAIQPISALESEYSLWTRDMEAQIFPTCRELGIGIVAYSPIGRGFSRRQFVPRKICTRVSGDTTTRVSSPRTSRVTLYCSTQSKKLLWELAQHRRRSRAHGCSRAETMWCQFRLLAGSRASMRTQPRSRSSSS